MRIQGPVKEHSEPPQACILAPKSCIFNQIGSKARATNPIAENRVALKGILEDLRDKFETLVFLYMLHYLY